MCLLFKVTDENQCSLGSRDVHFFLSECGMILGTFLEVTQDVLGW